MLATRQMIPARCVSVFSTPEKTEGLLLMMVTGDSVLNWFLLHYLSDALAKQTGYMAEHPAFSHFLYFFSDWSSSSSVSVAFLLLCNITKNVLLGHLWRWIRNLKLCQQPEKSTVNTFIRVSTMICFLIAVLTQKYYLISAKIILNKRSIWPVLCGGIGDHVPRGHCFWILRECVFTQD